MRAAVVLLALAACGGETGSLSVGLIAAPGSTLLDDAQDLHVTLTDPSQTPQTPQTPRTYDVPRGADGFDLAFDVTANGNNGTIVVDAYDGSGALIAVGQTPPLPIAAVTSSVDIFMAAPRSLTASPQVLATPCRDVATGALTYGAIYAGGTDGSGAPCSDLAIYNAYDHSLSAGSALPDARSGLALGVGGTGYIYLFGGTDGSGALAADLWRFDTTAAPSGSYEDIGNFAIDARSDARMVALGNEDFAVTGQPALALSGSEDTLTERTDITGLPAAGSAVTPADGASVAVFAGSGAGATGLEALSANTFAAIASSDGVPVRARHAVVAGPNDTLIVIGGSPIAGSAPTPTPVAILVDATTSTATTVGAALATPRDDAAVAATDRYVVVAGGTDAAGAVVATAEILDATTLALVATAPMVVPRTQANAVALPNGQVLILGGVDASGAPIATIELFTPDDPAAIVN